MNLSKVILIATLAIVLSLVSVEGQRCQSVCPSIFDPVCGHLRRPDGRWTRCTFSNVCRFRSHRCFSRQPWRMSPGACGPICRFSG